MINNKIKYGVFFLFVILLMMNVLAYREANPNYGLFNSYVHEDSSFDGQSCKAGQDFILQIAPFGCSPAVVRSDLLEEQNVPVFCQIAATKINPLIDVDAIEGVSFSGKYSEDVLGIGFHPAQASLGVKGDLNSPLFNNIGYVVIKLKKQPVEKEMPDYVEGNLTARIKYDIRNAFGIGKASFYLPVLSDEEFEQKRNQYSFWNGRGYLRADSVEADRATINMFNDVGKISSVKLRKGESSNKIIIPGFDCLASMKLRLDGLVSSDTRVKFDINGEIFEVARGERFLDNKCRVKKIDHYGIIQSVDVSCSTDEGTKSFSLKVSPKIKLDIDGVSKKEFGIGDYLFTKKDGSRVYLGFARTWGDTNKEENLYAYLISAPLSTTKEKLDNSEISSLARYDVGWTANSHKTATNLIQVFANWGNKIASVSWNIGNLVIKGKNIKQVGYLKEETIFEKKVKLLGFAGPKDGDFIFSKSNENKQDLEEELKKLTSEYDELMGGYTEDSDEYIAGLEKRIDEITKQLQEYDSTSSNVEVNYNKALKDYDSVLENYPTEKCGDITCGEEALYGKILLAFNSNQKLTANKLCDDFKSSYPDSEKSLESFCDDNWRLSSSEISTSDVSIRNIIKRISLINIFEPTIDDYSATISIRGSNGKTIEKTLTKNQIFYLDEYRGSSKQIYYDQDSSSIPALFRVYYGFNNKKWYWSVNKINWIETPKDELDSKSRTYLKSNYLTFSNSDVFSPGEKTKKIINELNGKDLREGIDVLKRNDVSILGSTEFIQLVDLDEDKATINYYVYPSDLLNAAKQGILSTGRTSLKKDVADNLGGDFVFTLVNVNLKKVAKVSLIPNIDNVGGTANFSFKIGIEKRAIQLSPKKTMEKINNLNKTIADWQDKSDKLGKVVKGLKGACLATGTYLTVKNFFANTQGKGFARQEAMNGKEGWNKKCANAVSTGKLDGKLVDYSSIDECLLGNSEDIDKDVDRYFSAMAKQNEDIKRIEDACPKTEFLTEVHIDSDCFKKKYSEAVKSELSNCQGEVEVKKGKTIKCSEIVNMIKEDSITTEQLKRLQLNSKINSDMAKAQFEDDLKDIYVNRNDDFNRETTAAKYGVKEVYSGSDPNKKTQKFATSGDNTWDDVSDKFETKLNIKGETYVEFYQDTLSGKKYLVTLDNNFVVKNTYEIVSVSDVKDKLEKQNGSNPNSLEFKKYDSSSYENPFKSVSGEKGVVAKFYDTAPYKGYPALVPFDKKHGWYAATEQVLPSFGGIKPYDESGRLTSFWVCNVGEDGIADFNSGINDDDCQQVNLVTGAPYDNILGLDKSQSTKIAKCAIKAIQDASRHKSGGEVRISTKCGNSISVKVGSPAVAIPKMQCTDYMSPKDCKLLFNVCDPVICPSSRCDLGGRYPVKDVIQTGIIGSLTLCLPNYKQGIYIPVCLTGLQAGIDSYLSIVKAHRDCLQESLKTGRTIGVCDEIYSIHLCEFFWRQALPAAKLIIPKLVEAIFGQNIRGGGEYLGVANAWKNAENSVNYFTQYYAANSINAFKARSAEDVGSAVCKSYVSGVYPKQGNLIDNLIKPDSPSQFSGRFDEIPFTSATVPAMSQYKVFYHIYAGKDRGVYYQVYLTEGEESSYYQDTSFRKMVASGYISSGEYADETKDFTAPTGYKKLCIRVNEQEECGFKQVSTSFAVNYVNDKYMNEQANNSNIKSEKECISGTASLYSLISPNLQEGANELIDPAIYNRGIIRICSTDNPGKGTDASRWALVGVCDDPKIKCWIDMTSVDNVIKDLKLKNQTLSELENNSLNALEAEGDYESRDTIQGKIKDKEGLVSQSKYQEVINLVSQFLPKTFWNDQKALLLLNRANAYSKLIEFTPVLEKPTETPKTETKEETKINKKCNDNCNPGDYQKLTDCKEIDESSYDEGDCIYEDGFVENNYCCFYEDKTEEELVTNSDENSITESSGDVDTQESSQGVASDTPDKKKPDTKETETIDRKDISYNFNSQRSVLDVLKIINKAKDNTYVNRRCSCGDNCRTYADLIVDFSQKYNISDPLLLLSLMMQESGCDYNEVSSSSVGLMQISSWDDCKSELSINNIDDLKGKENINKNIECGAIILNKKYNFFKGGRTFYSSLSDKDYKSCDNKINIKYYNWEAALRGYVGWGCNEGHDNYVKEVMDRFNELSGENNQNSGSSECDIISDFWVGENKVALVDGKLEIKPGRIYVGITTNTFDKCKDFKITIYSTITLGDSTTFNIDENYFNQFKSTNRYISEGNIFKVGVIKKSFLDYDPNYYKYRIDSPDGKAVKISDELKVDDWKSFQIFD